MFDDLEPLLQLIFVPSFRVRALQELHYQYTSSRVGNRSYGFRGRRAGEVLDLGRSVTEECPCKGEDGLAESERGLGVSERGTGSRHQHVGEDDVEFSDIRRWGWLWRWRFPRFFFRGFRFFSLLLPRHRALIPSDHSHQITERRRDLLLDLRISEITGDNFEIPSRDRPPTTSGSGPSSVHGNTRRKCVQVDTHERSTFVPRETPPRTQPEPVEDDLGPTPRGSTDVYDFRDLALERGLGLEDLQFVVEFEELERCSGHVRGCVEW